MLLNLWLRLLPVVADVQLSVATVVDDRTVVVRERLFVHLHRCNAILSTLSRMLRVCDAIKATIYFEKKYNHLEVCLVGQQQQQQINQFFFLVSQQIA